MNGQVVKYNKQYEAAISLKFENSCRVGTLYKILTIVYIFTNRRNDEELGGKRDKVGSSSKDFDRREKSPKEVEPKEKKKKEKKKKKKRDESANESGDQSDTGTEKKKKKAKKEKKLKATIGHDTLDSETRPKSPEDQTDNTDSAIKDEKTCDDDYDDQVVLHNQETFEDHISNLEQVLETSDIRPSNGAQRSKGDKQTNIEQIIPAVPEVSKWERSDGDDTAREDENSSKEDKDLREILKAKSSLSNLTPALKTTVSLKNVSNNDKEQEPDYDKLIQEKLNDQEKIDVNADSEHNETIELSDKDGMRIKRKSDRMSDSDAEEKVTKKKRRKDKKEKKKSKDSKKERKKNKKMLKELFGKDGLEKLLNKIDEGQLPEDILAKAVLAKTEKEMSRSPSPRPQNSREKKDHGLKTTSYEESRSQGKESRSRRAVVSDGTSLKMTIDRNSPREERPRGGKGDSVR